MIDGRATMAAEAEGGFEVAVGEQGSFTGSRLILATGIIDELPDIPGLAERWGKTVIHCPYCHGYEFGGGALGVLATGAPSIHQALVVADWGDYDLVLRRRVPARRTTRPNSFASAAWRSRACR